ncbi:hypothetical protein B0E53_00574 [Micromonospora sp. MH33]|nr:hypothetical protein B0E53_00574 [Micromonospora sp. MH33]
MAWLLAKSFGRVALPVVMTVALVIGTQALGAYLKESAAHWMYLPSWLATSAAWLGGAPGTNYQAVLTAALSVTGTLAGVYFATVSFVFSTTYKDATARVRALVTRLPGGRVYASVFFLAVLFTFATLAMSVTGREPNRLALCIVSALGGFVVLSFGRLRTQLYGLLEPVKLLSVVQRDVARWTAQAARLVDRDPTGSRTRLSRAQTLESLLALRDLCFLIRDRERAATNVPSQYAGIDPRTLSAARCVLVVWLQYTRRKQALLQLPGWCYRRSRHKDWLLASDYEVGVALATGTTLQAAVADDPLWVERYLSQILSEFLGGREAPQLANILDSRYDPVRDLLSHGMFAESRLWIETVVAPAKAATLAGARQEAAGAPNPEATDAVEDQPLTRGGSASDGHLYNLADFVALAYTQAVLGSYDYVQALSADFAQWTVAQARGKDERNLGPVAAEMVRNIRDALKFEESVEGHRVTSEANIKQLIARAVATETIDEATLLLAAFEDDFWPWARSLVAKDTPAAGAALSRLYEAVHKWNNLVLVLSELFEQCEAVHRDVDDRWPNLSLEGVRERLAALQDRLRAPIARVATSVDPEMSSDRPDVFGWAFYRAHQDLLDDVLVDQSPIRTDLEERLRGLVVATSRAGSRLRATVRREHGQVLGSFWSEPVLLLLQLSGVALVAGLARPRPDMLAVFESVWGGLLDRNPQAVLDMGLGAVAMDDALFGISPGKMKRANRHQQATSAFEEMGLAGANDGAEYDGLWPADDRLEPRTRAMLQHVSYGDFEDLFVAGWLVSQARRRGAVISEDRIGPRLRGLIRSLADRGGDETNGGAESPAPADGEDPPTGDL